jgi:hypothetical protein
MTTPDVSLARVSPTALTAAAPAGLDGALAAIDEMLDRLETVTHAGQQHLMAKIVSVLTAHPVIASGGPVAAARIERLRQESQKTAPDFSSFARATRALLSQERDPQRVPRPPR